MRKMGMKLALLGGFAGAALLAGCGNNPYDYGRKWALTAQEDYYSEEAQNQDPAAQASSNIGSSTTLYQTDEQQRGTGGAGESDGRTADNDMPRIQGSKVAQENLWLQQDMRVPFPPPEIDAARELGTGKPLRVELNGFTHEYQTFTIESVGDQIIGPTEVRRYLGADTGDAVELEGPMVLVRARIDAPTFTLKGKTYNYFDGMLAQADARVRKERILVTLIPGLKGALGHED